ncbi:MAG: GreA/GreB family elongation factor [Candidatus Saccharibacteria bacterium]
MKQDLLILESDKIAARQRIAEIDQEILDLGPRFYEVFNQTSETYHDNAPFEAVRDHQSLLSAERQKLKRILNNRAISMPKQKKNTVGIGSTVQVINNDTQKPTDYFIAGDWSINTGKKIDGALVVSRKSPIATALIGKKIDDEVSFNGHKLSVINIS